MNKKWYNFFVVTDGSAGAASVPEPAAAARRVEDVVPAVPVAIADETTVSGGASIADVYEAARIAAPAHGYTVLKVAEMLQSEHIRALPPDVKRKSVLVALDAAGVSIDAVVADAVARDRALDTYEHVLEQHVETLRAAKAAENEQIEAELARLTAELRAKIDGNNRDVSREHAELQAWRARKQHEESTIAEVVSHFVSENPITTMVAAAEAEGETDVR